MLERKHYTQFTNEEMEVINQKQKKAFVKGFAKHAIERMNEREVNEFFSKNDFYKTVRNGNVIEVSNRGNNDVRMLVRSKFSKQGKNLVLSYSFKWKKVVTCWTNETNDNHATINMKLYNEDMDVTVLF